ncbi:MAG: hypothetical protein ABIH08_01995 [Candidatus Omnitrophota bacterium]
MGYYVAGVTGVFFGLALTPVAGVASAAALSIVWDYAICKETENMHEMPGNLMKEYIATITKVGVNLDLGPVAGEVAGIGISESWYWLTNLGSR